MAPAKRQMLTLIALRNLPSMKRFTLAALVISVGISASLTPLVNAQMAVPAPPSNGYVLDQTNTLNAQQIASINDQIGAYRQRSGVQLAVLMVPTISKDDYLEHFSLNVARTWGVGQKDKNSGVLLLIAKNDRQMRIEVGTGLEGDLPDLRASRIIRERIAPDFQHNDYYHGIQSGIDGITLAIDSAADPMLTPETAQQSQSAAIGSKLGVITFLFYLLLSIISFFGALLARSKSWWGGGMLGGLSGTIAGYNLSHHSIIAAAGIGIVLAALGSGFDYLVSKNYKAARQKGHTPSWWAGGGFGGGFGSGGGGGFGGGGFGGGGASGRW